MNAVNRNTGDMNTGDMNTGDRNTGYWNTGDRNTGDRNTGDWNTGNRNTGDMNTGYWNTGNMNTGDMNTGNWNNTNCSTGFFCTAEQTLKIFDIDSGMTRDQLIDALPSVLWNIPFGNYRRYDKLMQYTADDRQKFYDNLTESDKLKIKSIPHFDAEKFEKCTGIKV